MSFPAPLHQALRSVVDDAELTVQLLPTVDIQLWLVDAERMYRQFTARETQRILETPPYWCFCWGAGLAMAEWITRHPQHIRGRRVLDIGSGSGICAIAAAKAGAAVSMACDLDPIALEACRANADLNGVQLGYSNDVFALAEHFDLLLAADMLYDPANLPLVEIFPDMADNVLIADSRVKHFQHTRYRQVAVVEALTCPDLDEPLEYRYVRFYQATNNAQTALFPVEIE